MIRSKAAELGGDVVILTPDLDRKGSDPERETLLAAIEGVEDGTYQGIIVAYLSRLSRRVSHTLEMWDRVKAAGGRVVAVQGNIDSAIDTPEARLQLTILAGIDEHEHAVASERFETLRASTVRRGIWKQANVPLGYLKDPDTRRLVPDPATADKVVQAFTSRAARQDLLTIALDLGLTTSGVRAMLRNRVYLGELRLGPYENLEAHPPLVTLDQWESAQVKSAPRRPRNRELAEAFLLTGLVRCGSCGHAMSPSTTSRQSAYKCHGRSSAGACPRPVAISQRLLEDHVEQLALDEFARLRTTVQEDLSAIEALRVQVRTAEAELSAYLGAVSAADVGADAFAAGARSRREALDQVKGQLQDSLTGAPSAPVGDLIDAWPGLANRVKNRALAGLVEAVVVWPAGPGRRVPLPDRVAVLAYGSGVVTGYRGGGKAMGIVPIVREDLDGVTMLGV